MCTGDTHHQTTKRTKPWFFFGSETPDSCAPRLKDMLAYQTCASTCAVLHTTRGDLDVVSSKTAGLSTLATPLHDAWPQWTDDVIDLCVCSYLFVAWFTRSHTNYPFVKSDIT